MEQILTLGTRILGISLTLYTIYTIFFPLPPLQERAIFVLLLMILLFFREAQKKSATPWRAIHLILAIAVTTVFGYIVIFHEAVTERVGLPSAIELIFGIMTIILVLEGTRRVMGWGLMAVILGFLLYGLLGEFIPIKLGGHSGFGLDRIVNTVYLTTNGIFGIVVYTMYKYVFLFIIFGCLLEELGALDFIMKLALSLVGHIRGGPAMISIVSSGLFGTISGSAVANVAVDGAITIPMMKKIGFEAHVAGAIEAAASNGGQIMPPVMGASAFLIAQFLGIPYLNVCKAAAIPAILYYVSLAVSIYIYATRRRLYGLPRNQLPPLKEVFLTPNALIFIVGLGTLFIFLMLRYSPYYAVLWSMLMMGISSFAGKEFITPKKVIKVLEKTSLTFLEVGVAGVGVGIVVGIVMLTGLAMRFSALIIDFSGGNLMLTLFLTMLASFILGMGLPTTVCYIILVILVVPALLKIGVLPLAAHLFIFYSGIMSMVTPPVALAAYAGACIAGASMWRTGFSAAILSLPAYILPYIFVLDNSLLLEGGSLVHVVMAIVRSFLGFTLFSYALIGPYKNRKELMERFLCAISGILWIWPDYWADAFALILLFVVVGPKLVRRYIKKELGAPTER